MLRSSRPPSCTFSRKHLAHCVLACMALYDSREKYEQLRNAYNSVVDEDSVCSLKVPPIEEWHGMTTLCDNLFCRWVAVFPVVIFVWAMGRVPET